MRKGILICGWALWFLGLVYAALGAANGEKVGAILRDVTLQKHHLWEDGGMRKAEAKVAIFDLSDQFASINQRACLTLGSLMALSTLLIVAAGKKPNQ